LVAAFTSMLATAQVAALDLAANYKAIGDKARGAMEPEFQKYGVSLTLFLIENISLPPEVEKMLDTRAQMGLVGDMGRFTQFQTAQAIPEAAKSGGAGDFMGMGVGVAMGQQMGAAMASSLSQSKKEEPGQAPQPQSGGKFCPQCGKPVSADAKFCSECGTPMQSNCPKCGKPNEPAAKFCQECGGKLK
jgi:membrane protease subunit (stomatin/prohibitin family)